MREPYKHKHEKIFIDIIPNVKYDMIFTQLVLDHSALIQDSLNSIVSHKVELWSRKLTSKLHYEKSNRKAMNTNWSNQKANPALKTKTVNK